MRFYFQYNSWIQNCCLGKDAIGPIGIVVTLECRRRFPHSRIIHRSVGKIFTWCIELLREWSLWYRKEDGTYSQSIMEVYLGKFTLKDFSFFFLTNPSRIYGIETVNWAHIAVWQYIDHWKCFWGERFEGWKYGSVWVIYVYTWETLFYIENGKSIKHPEKNG